MDHFQQLVQRPRCSLDDAGDGGLDRLVPIAAGAEDGVEHVSQLRRVDKSLWLFNLLDCARIDGVSQLLHGEVKERVAAAAAGEEADTSADGAHDAEDAKRAKNQNKNTKQADATQFIY